MEEFASSAVMNSTIAAGAFDEDVYEEACSICLEPFSCDDPATVTNCKHEYHLQCILEWSQRSKECPICWQVLILKDPSCQELLAAVEVERNLRSKRSSRTSTFTRIPQEDLDFDDVRHYTNDSDFDEHIMQHLTAAALGRAHQFSRRQRQRSSGMGPSQFLVFGGPSSESVVQHIYTTTPVDSQSSSSSGSPENNFSTVVSSERCDPPSDIPASNVNTSSNIIGNRHCPVTPGVNVDQTSPSSPRRSRPSELLSFSESLKSKFSAASAKYKESISKGTRGLKEKLLARNNSVKELSKEVQREVTAGIAGVTRMMERLDPTSKRTGIPDHVSSDVEGTSHLSGNGTVVLDNLFTQSPNSNSEGTGCSTLPLPNMHVSLPGTPLPARVEVTRVQDIL